MCLNPKWIYKKGFYKENNYNGAQGEFYELGTYSKCGSCSVCIAEKSNNWVIRNYYEEKRHTEKCFITLTYQENPIIVIRKDAQDFMKRLRRYLDYHEKGKKIRMFGAEEYGELNNRPHIHIIIYGWKDKNAKYLDINKRKNIVMQSEIIEKLWNLGRTSYQEFNEHEIPYIALYNTPQEVFKRAYKLNIEKIKQLEKYLKSRNLKNRKNIIYELNELTKELKESKKEYIMAKEFNFWSQALGWEEFEKKYYKYNNYPFMEYIEDKEFVTPTPWVKKLANAGDYNAILEMKKRQDILNKSQNEQEEKIRNEIKENTRRKKELKEWNDKKDKVIIL